MGWCSAGTHGEECSKAICDSIGGDYTEDVPTVCLVLTILEDQNARNVIASLVYPPLLRVRDDVLPHSVVGRIIRRDFETHYREAVAILREDPELLSELIRYMVAMVPFARAMGGEDVARFVPPGGVTPSTYTAARFRPEMVDRTSQLLERFRSAAGPELSSAIDRYKVLLPELTEKSPTDFLVALRQPALASILEGRSHYGSM